MVVGISCLPRSLPAHPFFLHALKSRFSGVNEACSKQGENADDGQLSQLIGRCIPKTNAAGMDLSITAVHRDSPSCRHEI